MHKLHTRNTILLSELLYCPFLVFASKHHFKTFKIAFFYVSYKNPPSHLGYLTHVIAPLLPLLRKKSLQYGKNTSMISRE